MIRKNRKKRARRKKVLLLILLFLLLAAILILIGITGFKLKKVQVSGNELYSDQQIKDSVLNVEYPVFLGFPLCGVKIPTVSDA